jgi:hypothetical protein
MSHKNIDMDVLTTCPSTSSQPSSNTKYVFNTPFYISDKKVLNDDHLEGRSCAKCYKLALCFYRVVFVIYFNFVGLISSSA